MLLGMDTTLAKKIKAGMSAKGWTAAALAGQLVSIGVQVSWRSVEHWVQGSRCPRPEAREALVHLGILPNPEKPAAPAEARA
jgi:hypothetical protein